MTDSFLKSLFDLTGQVAVVTGGTGVLGGAMARGLAQTGAKVAVLGRRREAADAVVTQIEAAGGTALATPADVLDRASLEAAREAIVQAWGGIDILVNGAGGNVPAATVGPDGSFFDVPADAFRSALDLNLTGTLLPSQVFGAVMAGRGSGSIVNISSMAAHRALTRVVAYGAAKAAVENFTRWLAVELAQKVGAGLRVNAIAPGFFVGEQNRRLLLNEDGTLTARGGTIIAHTPAGRFGEPEDLLGALLYLAGPASRFVTGTVLIVDGGVNAFSGI
ncbi:MAG: SDR family oxidoreductase [Chloroflexi bacterium]|nr:SDR family oxidoreductase [Chloroflexota bacterium]